MRKYQQKQILESIKTLYEATAEIKRFLSRKDSNSIMQLLADCQEMAIQIGNYIEKLEGEGTQTVSLLEEYCKLLYQSSVEINNDNFDSKIDKRLQKHLIKIENSVRDELKPNRIEIAFISYKASMSDSIESIYLAAKADPCCDAIFVPIPYYDINSDRSLGTMHYEGADCYGDNIEITDWRNYDIEVRHPDAIFTFNPYDEANFVTRVHPDFFCRKLRECTDLLVYVPYFIVSDDVPEHFCTLAGCVYAHKVVVQSEKIRDTYIRAFKKTFSNRFGKAEDKFVALGSPKFDKTLNIKREDCVLPDEWSKLINGKKVVFYNTSIGAILQGNEQYLKKLRHVLSVFKKCDDAVLWWRPHPLSKSTYASMRPGLLEEYCAIVEDYKRERSEFYDDIKKGGITEGKRGSFIYDDSPDFHGAIAWADAYYGDWSSLVALFEATGKPIVIQDVSLTKNDILLRVADFAIDDDGGVWGFELFEDGLFKLDFENNKARLVKRSGNTPKYMGKPLSTTRYVDIHCVGNNVICLPCFLDNILIFDRMTKASKEIPLNHDYILPSGYDGFALRFTVNHQNKIYAFGYLSKAIVVFDAETQNICYNIKLIEQIGELTDSKRHIKHPIYIGDCSDDGIIILLMKNCEHLIRYSLPTQDIVIIETNPVLSKCVQADFDGQNYWLIDERNEKLIKWNPDYNETKEYHMSDSSFVFPQGDNVFTGISDCGDFLLMFPGLGSKLLKFDKKHECFSEYAEMPVPDDNNNGIFKYDRPKRVGNKIYAFARYNFTMYELDILTGKITPHKLCLDEESYKLYFDNYFDNINSRINERALGNIANFFAVSIPEETKPNIEQSNNFLNISANKDGTAGKAIYDYILKAVK